MTYETLIATGFHRVGPRVLFREKQNPQYRYEYLNDMIGTTTRAFLGLTVACARCHDHKFDPISQMDYYRMMAIFFPFIDYDYPLAPPAEAAAYAAKKSEIDAKIQALTREVRRIEDPYIEAAFQKRLETFPEDVRIAVRTPEEKRTPGQKLLAAQMLSIRNTQRAADHVERCRSRRARESCSRDSRHCGRSFRRRCRSRPASATAITGSRRTVRETNRWRAPLPTGSRWISRAASCRSPASRTAPPPLYFPAMAEPGKGKLSGAGIPVGADGRRTGARSSRAGNAAHRADGAARWRSGSLRRKIR